MKAGSPSHVTLRMTVKKKSIEYCIVRCVRMYMYMFNSVINQTTPTPQHWMYCFPYVDDAIHSALRGGSGLINETVCVHMQACACVYVCVSKWLGELAQNWLFSFTLNLSAVRYTIYSLILLL